MRFLIFTLIVFALLWSGIMATTTSVLMQSLSLVVLSASCILTAIHSMYSRGKLFPGIALKPFLVTLCCAIYFLTRALLSEAIDLGIGDSFLILSGFLIYLLTCYWGKDRLYYRMMIGAVMLLALLNVLNFVPSIGALRDELIPFSKGSSETGLFNHRNFMSHYLMMVVLLLLSIFIIYRKNKVINYLCLVMAIVGIYAIYMVKARAGYVGLVSGLAVLSFFIYDYYLKNKSSGIVGKLAKVSLLLCVLCFIGKIGNDIYHERSNSNVKASEIGDRLHYFSQAIDQVPDALFLGSGSMSYSYKCYWYWGNLPLDYMDHMWVHNEFLQALADYGLIGLLLMITMLFSHLWNAVRCSLASELPSSHSTDHSFYLRVAGLCMIIASTIDMMGSFSAHAFPNIMLMAIACAWMTFKNEGNQNTNDLSSSDLVSRSSMKYGTLVAFTLFGSASLLIAMPQLRAAMVFSKYEIYDESANWSAKDSIQSKWLPALEEVVAVTPSYLRHQRLSGLYLEYAVIGNEEDSQRAIKNALIHSQKAIVRHPHDPVSIANHAYCLFKLKQYKDADSWYEILQKRTVNRQKYFQSSVKRAHNLCYLAQEQSDKGQTEEARKSYATAFESCINSKFRNDQFSRSIITMTLSARTNFLIKNKFYDELDQMYEDFEGDISVHHVMCLYKDLVFTSALAYTHYADLKFSQRKPELALKWYFKAYHIINHSIPDKKNLTQEVINRTIKYLESKTQFLSEAKIVPAK